MHSAISEGSWKTYERTWKTLYVKFYSEFRDSRSAFFPVSINNLAVFISYLSARKFASSTISTYVSTLSYVHKLGNLPDPTKNVLVQKLLAAHGKLHSSPDVRLPIVCSILKHLVLALNNTNSSVFQRLLYQIMFLVAFYSFFRDGELTAKGANFKPLLEIRDLHFHLTQNFVTSATIVIKDFKHNTNRHPFSVVLECTKGTELCPCSIYNVIPLLGVHQSTNTSGNFSCHFLMSFGTVQLQLLSNWK